MMGVGPKKQTIPNPFSKEFEAMVCQLVVYLILVDFD